MEGTPENFCSDDQGRIQTEVEGGATWNGGAKNTIESERAEGAQKFLEPYSRKFSGFSTEWRLSLYASSHSERNTEKRARLGQVKGRFSCQKGGAKSEFSS